MRLTLRLFAAAGFIGLTIAASGPLYAAVAPGADGDNAAGKPATTTAPGPIPATLRNTASVNGGGIKLGDLFLDAGARADEIVATSPAPGSSIVFQADWLAAIARRHGLDWTAPNSFVQIRVEREGTLVSAETIRKALTQKMADGRTDKQVRLDTTPRLYTTTEGGTPDMDIENLSVDEQSGHFSADLSLASDDAAAQPVHITGRVEAIVQMPTLIRPMMPGEVIQKEDITWTTARLDQLPAGDVTDPATLIGRSPRHPLHAQQFLRPMDVQQPVLVKRNELVLIVLEQPGMYLTAEGKALEDGGKGEVIRVTNVQSNRAIDAVVTGTGRVGIVTPGMQAMNNQTLSGEGVNGAEPMLVSDQVVN